MIGLAMKARSGSKVLFYCSLSILNDKFIHKPFPLNLFGLKKIFGVTFRNLYVSKPELLLYWRER